MRSAISFAFCLVLALAAATAAMGQMAHPMLGEKASDFGLTTLAGGSAELADYRGKTVVLHFAAGR